jgi:sterol desaturase/sphingolipid hydroxylase (fatty acid hydroxylase superfamily)
VFAKQLVWALVFHLGAFGVLTAVEIFWRRDSQSIRERVNGLAFWAIFIPIQIAAVLAGAALLKLLGVRPLLSVSLDMGWAGWLGALLASILGFAWLDFFFYWSHRAQHRFFWRWHKVHHSVRNLSAINSYHHWSDPLFTAFLFAPPAALIDIGFAPSVGMLSILFSAQPLFLHSSTTLHFGPLGKAFVDNRFHRIHHSLEAHHLDRNFGAMTTLWDRLFGTAYFPAKDEWPAVGVAGLDEPRSIREWSAIPFKNGPPAQRLREGVSGVAAFGTPKSG